MKFNKEFTVTCVVYSLSGISLGIGSAIVFTMFGGMMSEFWRIGVESAARIFESHEMLNENVRFLASTIGMNMGITIGGSILMFTIHKILSDWHSD